MSATSKMICPDCGVEMNHHADKLVYEGEHQETNAVDAELGGVLEEAHTCPACGKTLTRREDGEGEAL